MHVQEFRDNVESWDRKIMQGSNVRIKAYESDGKRDDRQKLDSWNKRGGDNENVACASTNENLIRSFNLPDDSTCGLINLG